MSELHLRVFRTRSELVLPDGTIQVFLEGGMSQSAKLKYQKIAGELSKGYLEQQIIRCRDNLAELDFSRLNQIHLDTLNQLVGSVTSEVGRALIAEEILARCQEIEDELGISIEILTFRNWVKKQFERGIGDSLITEKELAIAWITAYTESLAQRRREIAPIDEPCHQWLTSLKAILEN